MKSRSRFVGAVLFLAVGIAIVAWLGSDSQPLGEQELERLGNEELVGEAAEPLAALQREDVGGESGVESERPEAVGEIKNPMVQGHVFDWQGNPISGAKVFLDTTNKPQLPIGSLGWTRVKGSRVLTDKEGAYSIFSEKYADSYQVTVWHSDFVSGYSSFSPGDRGLDLVLVKSWRVIGKFNIAEEVRKSSLSVRLTLASTDSTKESESSTTLIGPTGEFVLYDQENGTYLLEVVEGMSGRSIFSRSLSLGPEGGVKEVPDINLSDKLRSITITVRDENGKAPQFSWAANLDNIRIGSGPRGEFQIILDQNPIDIEIGATGCRSEIYSSISENLDVVLAPGFSFHIVLEKAIDLPENVFWALAVGRIVQGGPPESYQGGSAVLEKHLRGDFILPQFGEYGVVINILDMREDYLTMPKKLHRDGGLVIFELSEQNIGKDFIYTLSRGEIEQAQEFQD